MLNPFGTKEPLVPSAASPPYQELWDVAVLHGSCWLHVLLGPACPGPAERQYSFCQANVKIKGFLGGVKSWSFPQSQSCARSLLVTLCCRLWGENPQTPGEVRMLQEWELLGSSRYVSVLLSSTAMGCVCSSPALVAKRRGFEFKPRLSIPGSCSPSNQNRELMQKLSRVHPALYKARNSC